MLDFIVKYWLEVAFGLVCGAVAWLAKKYVTMSKTEKENHETAIITTIQKKMDDQYDKTQEQMDACYNRLEDKISDFVKQSEEEDEKIYQKIGNLEDGILSLQGQQFKESCHQLLDQKEPITFFQYDKLMTEHKTYNKLGGNHDGDELFHLVSLKYEKQQSQK